MIPIYQKTAQKQSLEDMQEAAIWETVKTINCNKDMFEIEQQDIELRKQSLKNICDAFKKEHDEDNVNDQVLEEFNKKRQRDEEDFEHIQATSTGRRINRLRKETIWWGITHPSLSDTSHIDDIRREVKESTFKEYYHIILSTFKTLMNILLGTEPYRRCDESELACSVWKQVAVVLWRFSNTHLGYRIAKDKFGCSHGSYNNFTDQFILAMSSIVIDNVII
ncbi:hypothetical protein J3Q64DRAFT_1837556 [Phycomyces blakesleeanus]|uniref:Fungal-type protein kinase domain-containing protein n=1 Tax=Phycomyces blakesleeanus TaxID=4837 RepID=A0ABR3AV54_PHYBL